MPPTNTDTARAIEALRDGAGLERRYVPAGRLEVRAANDDGSIPFRGHAAVFNEPTYIRTIFGGFHEQVAPGAFRKTIREADIRLLFNHSPNFVLARNTNGTLRLEEDAEGLLNDADMLPTSYARDLALALERGDVSQMSFGFETIKDTWGETESGAPLRTLLEVKLFDTSVVTYPAYPTTDAALRSATFAGIMHTLRLDQLPEEERGEVLTALASGKIPPERLEGVRAAHQALGALLEQTDPASGQSARQGEAASKTEPSAAHSGIHPSVLRAQADLMRRGLPLRA